jgi:thiol:disulfide interchange protein
MILGIVGTVLFLLSAVIVLLALSIFGVAAFSLESSMAN